MNDVQSDSADGCSDNCPSCNSTSIQASHPLFDDVVALTQALVQRQSLTPDDAGVQDILAEALEPLGFDHLDCSSQGIRNSWYRIGEARPLLCFLGHSDVVPTGDLDAWTYPPFAATIDEGVMYGRGTADMKGSVAAMVVAMRRVVGEINGKLNGKLNGKAEANNQLKGSLALLMTSDEEGPAEHGTRAAVEQLSSRGEQIDYCCVGEPSCDHVFGDTMRVGRRGSLTAYVTIKGRQGHVAYPHKATNAVHAGLAVVQELCQHTWDHGDEDFPPTTMQVVNCQAGTGASNVIPGTWQVELNWRHGMASGAENIIKRVEQIFQQHQAGSGLQYDMKWRHNAPPFRSEPGPLRDGMKEVIFSVTGQSVIANCAGGTSDGRFIAPTGASVIEFGPRNASIHQIDEHVAVVELEQLADCYEGLIRRLLLPA